MVAIEMSFRHTEDIGEDVRFRMFLEKRDEIKIVDKFGDRFLVPIPAQVI